MPTITSITKSRNAKVTKDLVTAEVSLEKYKALQSEIDAILNEARAMSHQIKVDSTVHSQRILEDKLSECEGKIEAKFAHEIARLNLFEGELKASLPSLTDELSGVVFQVVLNTYNRTEKVH